MSRCVDVLGRFRTHVALLMAGCLSIAFAPTTLTTPRAPGPLSTEKMQRPHPPDCGEPRFKASGKRWKCTFVDRFTGDRLNPSKWSVQTTAATGMSTGSACYLRGGRSIRVRNGSLFLKIEKRHKSFRCRHPGNTYRTRYTGGSVTTSGIFSQTYGRFEIRAKVPDSVVPGLQSSIWLYPQDLTYGDWPRSGEIDIAETYTQYPGLVVPFLHHEDQAQDPRRTRTDCRIRRPAAFHTFTLIWTRSAIQIRYDGQTCLVNRWRAPDGSRRPFDHAYFLALTGTVGSGTNFVRANTQFPDRLQVDYVKVWK